MCWGTNFTGAAIFHCAWLMEERGKNIPAGIPSPNRGNPMPHKRYRYLKGENHKAILLFRPIHENKTKTDVTTKE